MLLQGHPNIVTLHEVLLPPVAEGRPQEMYLVFERVFTDLGKVCAVGTDVGCHVIVVCVGDSVCSSSFC